MFVELSVLLLVVYGFGLSNAGENEWDLFENKYKYHNREELVISDVTADLNFTSNFVVEKWETLSIGTGCYTGGIVNGSKLAILFSEPSSDASEMGIIQKVFDLKQPVSDVQFFRDRQGGKQIILVVAYSSRNNEFIWYSIEKHILLKMKTWKMESYVSHFSMFKVNNKNFLIASVTNAIQENAAVLYMFNSVSLERWYYQSISLAHAAPSTCVSSTDSDFYLSIVQPASSRLLVYQLSDNRRFIPFVELESSNIDQVVCFENGFKPFIAFTGLNASIYEFTSEGLNKNSIVNSNLEGVHFWLPVPVSTYRDETILLLQRKLDHDSHSAFEIDIVTYNGNKFEEHEDVPCSLFGERQNGLTCLTEYNGAKGIVGSSYLAVLDHLALIVPKLNSTSTLFNLKIDLKRTENPAEKELQSLLERKKLLQGIIDKQKKQLNEVIESQKNLTNQLNLSEQQPQLKSAKMFAEEKSNGEGNTKFSKLRNQAIDLIKQITDLNETISNEKPTKQETKYESITFNGPVEIERSLKTSTLETKDKAIMDLLNNIVRKDQLKLIETKKSFKDLTTDEVQLSEVNDIPSSEFVSNNNGVVELTGDIKFKNLVEVDNLNLATGIINIFKIDDFATTERLLEGPIYFQQLDARSDFKTGSLNDQPIDSNLNKSSQLPLDHLGNPERLFIAGNVTVKKLNGHDFEGFLRKICANNVKCHIPSLKILGSVTVRDSADIELLNGLKFPEDYVVLQPKEPLVITGAKSFTNITRGYNFKTNGTINNVHLDKIVNLSGTQHITGTITFDNLEVTSVLNVDGKVKGDYIEKFVPNVGLKETSDIKSNVEFSNLEVLGDVIISQNLNGTGLSDYLENIVLKNDNATITGSKTFSHGFSVSESLYIGSSSINNISLTSIFTKDSDQELKLNTIEGNVTFKNVCFNGLWNGENITELNSTLVRLSENQTIDSELIFIEDLLVETLIIDPLSNKKDSENITNNTVDNADTNLEELDVENILVEGNIIGNIHNFDLKDLNENYLKYTQNQSISAPYHIDKLRARHIEISRLNNISFNKGFSYEKLRQNITDLLTYRNATIGTLYIKGDVNLTTIDGEGFGKIVADQAWVKLHRNSSNVTIDGDVYFKTLEIEKLANTYFDPYVKSLVFKNETVVEIENSVNFENGIKVRKLIETTTLNGIALKNIFRVAGNQTVIGPITIMGDVIIEDDVNVKEMINNVEVTYILNNFEMGEESLKVKGEVLFQRMSYIQNLTINGFINGKDFKNLSNNFVYANEDINLEKDIIFNDMVDIGGNLGIAEDINGIDLSDVFPKIVWLTEDREIEGPIKFLRPVDCYQSLNVESKMKAALLFGRNLEDHIKAGVSVNKGAFKGMLHFENLTIHENLVTKFINNIDMDTIIPLKTAQNISDLNVGNMSVAHDIPVVNSVNGANLTLERDKTLFSDVEQHLSSEIVFMNNVLIEDNLVTVKVNGKLASNMVTTNTDQNLTAEYNFNSKCWLEEHLMVSGLINGVNLTSWKNNAIAVHSEEAHHIKGNWMVMDNLNLVGPLNGDGMVNDINITQLVKEVESRESYLCDIEERIAADLKNICQDLTYIYNKTKKQIQKFEYFEHFQKLVYPNNINYVKYFTHHGNHYLLINEEKSCFSDLLAFDGNHFSKITTTNTGGVSQIETVKGGNDFFLISRGVEADNVICSIKLSTIVWKWTDGDLKALVSTEYQDILQTSEKPLTFYGLKRDVVTEFRLNLSSELIIQEHRKWNIMEDNAAFIPRGLQIGVALRTGMSSILLNRAEQVSDEEYGMNTKATIRGNLTKKWNNRIPGRNGGDVVVVNVGIKKTRKALLAVANHKETQVGNRLDIVEIYLDPFQGELFDQILTYRPTALTSIEFENGETLLAFMEDAKILQIYEYKGIEGFKHRSSIKIQADQTFLMDLPDENRTQSRKVLALVHQNKITLVQAIMVGNKVKDDLQCENN